MERRTSALLFVILLGAACAPGTDLDVGERGAPLFVPEMTSRLATDGGASRGVGWADFDDDGDPDLYVANTDGQINAFYRNLLLGDQGDGRSDSPIAGPGEGFLKLSESNIAPYGIVTRPASRSEGVSWVDYDADGDLDLYVVNRGSEANLLYRNEGGTGFVRVTEGPLVEPTNGVSMACWADVDGDGWLDVFLAGYDGPNTMYRNVGGRFEEVYETPLRSGAGESRACGWADTDDDGRPDLYVANNTRAPNRYFRNLGNWRFEPVSEGHAVEHVAYSYGVSWADDDGDGDPDLFVANFDSENVIYRNDGGGRLVPDTANALSREVGGASKGHAWGDYDLDGDLDLFIANGTYGPDMRNFLYTHDVGEYRRDMRGDVAVHADTSAGVAWSDHDRDGDLDLFVANWGSQDQVNRFYRNTTIETSGGNWLGLVLRGSAPNTFAVGARVRALVRIGGDPRWMTRWQYPATGYGSQNEQLIHFGLGDAPRADSVVIRWPGGAEQAFAGVAAGVFWVAREGADLEAADWPVTRQ